MTNTIDAEFISNVMFFLNGVLYDPLNAERIFALVQQDTRVNYVEPVATTLSTTAQTIQRHARMATDGADLRVRMENVAAELYDERDEFLRAVAPLVLNVLRWVPNEYYESYWSQNHDAP